MNNFASSIAALQKRKRLIRSLETFNSAILIYNTSIPVCHKATIPHFFDLMLRSLSDVEFDWRLWGFISQRCISMGNCH